MKELGDELYVAVTSDEIVKRDKKYEPIHSEEERRYIIESLECVNRAVVIGGEGQSYGDIINLEPDVYTYGYDQEIPWLYGLMELLDCEYVQIEERYNDGNTHSSIIKERIRNSK